MTISDLDPKDPNDVIDYSINWARYLNRIGDEILSSSWPVVPDGITLQTHTHNDTLTTAWLSGGTAGSRYKLTNRIVTVGGRTLDRSITIKVREL
jgi:hypothetical protein